MLALSCLTQALPANEKPKNPANNRPQNARNQPISFLVNTAVPHVSEKQQQQPQQQQEPVDFAAIAARQQYVPDVNYLSLLEPQFQQYPSYNFLPEKQSFPR